VPLVSPRVLFRALALAEAVTWTLLIAGMLLKYAFEVTDVGVSIGGGLHGFAFLAFAAASVILSVNQRWSLAVTLLALASAVVPYATIPVERWLERHGHLDGDWRRVATDHPRDGSAVNRMLRWALANTVMFAALVVVVVAGVFVALLVVGPPGA
jgi:integral membrane protein